MEEKSWKSISTTLPYSITAPNAEDRKTHLKCVHWLGCFQNQLKRGCIINSIIHNLHLHAIHNSQKPHFILKTTLRTRHIIIEETEAPRSYGTWQSRGPLAQHSLFSILLRLERGQVAQPPDPKNSLVNLPLDFSLLRTAKWATKLFWLFVLSCAK